MRRFTVVTIDGENVLLENITMSTLLSGEDQANDCLVVEEQNGYEIVDFGAIAADEVLGTTGASGDLLVRITVTEVIGGAALNVYDGPVATGDLLLTIPTTGVSLGDQFEFGVLSKNGGFTIDYDAAATGGIIVCVGRFS